MRTVEIVVVLPFPQFLVVEDDVVADSIFIEELIELLIIDPVRTFDLSIEPRCSRLDIDVTYISVLQIPVELRLELRPIIRLYHPDPER